MSSLVSIIMPSYNTAFYISKTLKSVQSQTYTNWELIIVEDCSTDGSHEIIVPFLVDERIRYLRNEKNLGAALSRNRALRKARGKWVAFLDSDDLWAPDKLEKQIQFMKTNCYVFSYTDYKIQLNGKWLPYIFTGPKVVTKCKMYNYCYISTITAIYDRDVVGLVQIKDIKKNNDYAMWLKIIELSPCYRLPGCYSYYIKHDGSLSSDSKLRLIKYFYIMWRDVLEKTPVVAILLTINNLFWGVLKRLYYRERIPD